MQNKPNSNDPKKDNPKKDDPNSPVKSYSKQT
jgi:hypothetical protein